MKLLSFMLHESMAFNSVVTYISNFHYTKKKVHSLWLAKEIHPRIDDAFKYFDFLGTQ